MTFQSTIRAIVLLTLLLPLRGAAQGQRGPLTGLDGYIESAIAAWGVPGLAISIVKNDSVIFARGYGHRQIGRPDPVDERTVFAIGSASKAFTTASLAMLVDEGTVRWDDKVTTHLHGFQLFDPYVTREMTVRDLLTHRSGLSRGDQLWYGSDLSRDEIVRRIRFLEPIWSFRSRFGYQNLMFLTAGEIVETVSGLTWDDFVKQRIFAPLGMSASNTSTNDLSHVNNLATPHAKLDGDVVPIGWRNIDNIAAAGSINSNVLDMAQWVRLQLGAGEYADKRIITSGAVKEMHTPQTVIRREGLWDLISRGSHFLTYGLGWFLQDYRDRLVVHHGGNIDGMSAMVAMMPEEQLGVVILTNLNSTVLPVAVMNRVFDLMLGAAQTDWSAELLAATEKLEIQAQEQLQEIEEARIAGTSPSLDPEAYVGVYVDADSLYGEIEIASEGGKLVARRGPAVVGDVEHWHYDTFRVTWRDRMLGESFLRFVLDNEGKVSQVNVQGLADFTRVAKQDYAPAANMSER